DMYVLNSFRVEHYGWENSCDYLMVVESEMKFIPGDHVFVCKRTGKLRLVGIPGLPWLFPDPTEGMTPIGDVPDERR
ncbi:MAG: hypothetical protein ACRDUX_40115, partial [Mycobacterium sp.]